MAYEQRLAPQAPFKKENGKWTFYDYPGGIQTEAGEYPTEEEAKDAFDKVYRIWFANKGGDGPINSTVG
ncbi:MAG TPA: hypothetical protein VJW77_07105 [Terriglobia bacterium]|nr:hypothetical protein [Terriglobia bacterium]